MKKSLLGLFGGLGLIAIGAMGCGDSGGGGGGYSAALASCNAYCDAYIAAACGVDAFYASAAECKTQECIDTSAAPSACNGAIKTYYDCRATQADLCMDNGCDTQSAAIGPPCGF